MACPVRRTGVRYPTTACPVSDRRFTITELAAFLLKHHRKSLDIPAAPARKTVKASA